MYYRPKHRSAEIGASSLADIAFLLLSYFLMTTEIANEKGLPLYLPEWRKAEVREACFSATESPLKDAMGPKLPQGDHRIDHRDFYRVAEMTAALNCYLVTNADAVCEPHNRAYIVDYITRYLDKKAQMLRIAAKYGEAEKRNVEQLWDSPRNRAIDNALAHDFKNDRLIKADFGWSFPSALSPLLVHTDKNFSSPCALTGATAARSAKDMRRGWRVEAASTT